MTTEPPPTKKIRIQNSIVENIDKYIGRLKSSESKLYPLVDDSLYKPVPSIKVYIGHVKDQRDISRAILILNEKVPLKELQHLKRARKKEVLLCPSHFLSGMSSIQEYIEQNVLELKDVFEYFKELDVPFMAPKLKSQYKDSSKSWPCNFHPNKCLERMFSGNFFSTIELRRHKMFMEMAFEVAKWYLNVESNKDVEFVIQNINAAIVVDENEAVVAAAFDNRENHPIQHSAMLAIDKVAKTQDGGAWMESADKFETTEATLAGIDYELRAYLKEKYFGIHFFASKFRSKRDVMSGESAQNGPYLCTNYSIYLLREPCLMCSMGLLHARVKRIFFCFENKESGAVMSKTKLQTVQSLNHHYEVFTGFL